jgi:acetyltransferase-like isoleucine patch superfamily enzyme
MIGRVTEKIRRTWFSAVHAGRFRAAGSRTFVVSPFRADGADGILFGDACHMQRGAWLYCVGIEGKSASISIGNGCVFGYHNHITAVRDVRIGDYVLTANNVYISDNVHGFEDPSIPVMYQPVRFKQEVSIGSGSWLGENVCVIGASIGQNCVIGANAVVTHDIPDRCVAVGSPARVIRHYDEGTRAWMPGARP